MKIKSFSPTTDWYFVFCGVKDEIVNYRLAGFATVEGEGGESDQIVGMVPVTGGGQNSIMPGVCHLSTSIFPNWMPSNLMIDICSLLIGMGEPMLMDR
jgi:hypothetical protein